MQKPAGIREFSPRSVLIGLLVALVIGASYPYMVLKFGFGPNVSVVSAFFGFLALGLFSRSYNRWENNIVQTAGTTAGQIAFLCWLLAAFDILAAEPGSRFQVRLTWEQTWIWLSASGLLGVFLAVGRPELYLFLWLLPEMSVWRVLNRLRAIAEHGGMARSADRRMTTHHVRQSRLARFWIVPYNTGWHLAHHVDSGIPFRKLPAYHDELVRSGYVQPPLEYRNYRALWRKLASG
jgi:fatty acid desaturase